MEKYTHYKFEIKDSTSYEKLIVGISVPQILKDKDTVITLNLNYGTREIKVKLDKESMEELVCSLNDIMTEIDESADKLKQMAGSLSIKKKTSILKK